MSEMEIVLAFLAWWGLGIVAAFVGRSFLRVRLRQEYPQDEYRPLTRRWALFLVALGLGGAVVAVIAAVLALQVGVVAFSRSKWWGEPLWGRK